MSDFVPYRHPAALAAAELLAECSLQNTRRSGPGGQHRNKVETAVVLTHGPSGVRVEASERRSQAENRTRAIFRLRLALAEQVRQPCDTGALPSGLWQSRARGKKLSVSSEHDDFPALLAEALDAIQAHDCDVSAAAVQLDVSTTQLVRFVQQAPDSWRVINAERQKRGLRPLR
jgi:hypothetical protein